MTVLDIAELEERLAVQRIVSAFLIAFLVDDGLIDLATMRSNIILIAQSGEFQDQPMADIENLFGLAERTLAAIGRGRKASDDNRA